MNATSKILYAEDDSDDRFFLSESLAATGWGADLIYASDGEEAISYLESVSTANILPSLIVLDLNMPRRDGKQTLQYIKSKPRFSKIPVIILSTSANKAEMDDCTSLGAVSYFKKPTHFTGYFEIVKAFQSFI
jgi:CheY-like chemotaxis protein